MQDLKTVVAEVNTGLQVAVAALSAVQPQDAVPAAEIEKGIELAEQFLLNAKSVKDGFTEEEWKAFVASKDADDTAIENLPG